MKTIAREYGEKKQQKEKTQQEENLAIFLLL